MHGSHLSNVTWIIYVHTGSPILIDVSYKMWLLVGKQFQKRRSLNIIVIYMYIVPG